MTNPEVKVEKWELDRVSLRWVQDSGSGRVGGRSSKATDRVGVLATPDDPTVARGAVSRLYDGAAP